MCTNTVGKIDISVSFPTNSGWLLALIDQEVPVSTILEFVIALPLTSDFLIQALPGEYGVW